MQIALNVRVYAEVESLDGLDLGDLCLEMPAEGRIITAQGREVAQVEAYYTEGAEICTEAEPSY